MKKALAIVVAFMYLAITSGLVMQVHYCMGRKASSSLQFGETNDHGCKKCGMENGKGKCCHDEVSFIKLQDAHKQVSTDISIHPPTASPAEPDLINPLLCCNAPASTEDKNYPPPAPESGQVHSLFLFNCVFRL